MTTIDHKPNTVTRRAIVAGAGILPVAATTAALPALAATDPVIGLASHVMDLDRRADELADIEAAISDRAHSETPLCLPDEVAEHLTPEMRELASTDPRMFDVRTWKQLRKEYDAAATDAERQAVEERFAPLLESLSDHKNAYKRRCRELGFEQAEAACKTASDKLYAAEADLIAAKPTTLGGLLAKYRTLVTINADIEPFDDPLLATLPNELERLMGVQS